MLGELKELQRKLMMQHKELTAAILSYDEDVRSFNTSSQGLRDHVLAFLSWLRSLGAIKCYTGGQLVEAQNLGREIDSYMNGARGLNPLKILSTSDVPPPPEPPTMVWQPVSEKEVIAHLEAVNAEVKSFVAAPGGVVAFALVYTDLFGLMTEVGLGVTVNREEEGVIGFLENVWTALADHFSVRFLKRY